MRKSSQGPKRPSQAFRTESDDNRASSTRRVLDSRRGSGIPQPQGRRSSSETRDGRMSAIQQPTMKRSKSQMNLALTPSKNFLTPVRVVVPSVPGSTQSQRFQISPFSDGGRSSRMSTYSGVGPGKPTRVVKDTRPLSDRAFQHQEIQKIMSFLHSQPEFLSIAPKGLNLRQLTLKLFVDIVNYLMGFVDETVNVNMTNYVTEIPLILKRWGYVGNMNTSWLKTVNTPHALPHVIGVLSWLVTLASSTVNTDWEAILQDALQNTEDDQDADSFPYGDAAVYFQHFLIQYRSWNKNDEAAEEMEERRFTEELCNRNGVGDEELRILAKEIQTSENQLNDPKEKGEMEAAMEEEIKYKEVVKDYNKCVEYKLCMADFLHSIETALEEAKQKLRNQEELLRNLQSSELELKELLSQQTMTVEERDELIKLCNELSTSIRANEEFIAVVSNQIYADDLEMAKKRASIEKKTQAYNKIIVMESCWLPELESLRFEPNFLRIGAREDLDEINSNVQKLKTALQKKRGDLNTKLKELKSEIQQIEERKHLVLQEVQQHIQGVKQCEESIENVKIRSAEETCEMRKTIDSLKTANETLMNAPSLEEAKERLNKLIEKKEYGKAHIEKLKMKAEKFFEVSVGITRKHIDTILKAESEFHRKKEELMKNALNKLLEVQKEVDGLEPCM